MSQAPAVQTHLVPTRREGTDSKAFANSYASVDYVRKDIFDAYKAAVDAYLEWQSMPFDWQVYEKMEQAYRLMQAAHKAGESVK